MATERFRFDLVLLAINRPSFAGPMPESMLGEIRDTVAFKIIQTSLAKCPLFASALKTHTIISNKAILDESMHEVIERNPNEAKFL